MKIVRLEELNPRMRLAKPVYDDDERILLNTGVILNEYYIKRLKEMGINEVYVEDEISKGIEIKSVISDKQVIKAKKVIRKVVSDIKKRQVFPLHDVEQTITEILDEIFLNPDYLLYFGDLRSTGDNLFSHSVNVAVISIAIGSFLVYQKIELLELGIGALLHDIGKSLLIDETARKNPLEENGEDFRSHPELGYNLVKDRFDMSPLSKIVILSHHERIDGCGYPNGIKGNKIHDFAKITAVANTFDILTNGHYFKRKWPVYQAVEYLVANSNTRFDKKITDAFIRRLALYPNATMVKLNTGEIGIVIEQNENFPTRPIIRVIYDKHGHIHKDPRIENLLTNHSVVIVETL